VPDLRKMPPLNVRREMSDEELATAAKVFLQVFWEAGPAGRRAIAGIDRWLADPDKHGTTPPFVRLPNAIRAMDMAIEYLAKGYNTGYPQLPTTRAGAEEGTEWEEREVHDA
jgi:hypothetical protein